MLRDFAAIDFETTNQESSGFANRKHPICKRLKFHTGIDIPKAKGTPVYATGSGIVTRKGYNSGYGNFIEIQHAGGFRSFYAHLSKTLVSAGDSVQMDKCIACVGNSGLTTGCPCITKSGKATAS